MTDIVYILGNGSKWDNNELRYSLRSVEKHLKNVRNVYLIGSPFKHELDKRIFGLQNVIELPFPEGGGKLQNIINKTLAACNHPDISETFICFYDDHFLLSDFDADNFPYFHKGELSEAAKKVKGGYHRLINATEKQLKDGGFATLNYNVHFPLRIEKSYFRLIPFSQTLHKSLYGNMNTVGGEFHEDYKLFVKKTAQEYLTELKDAKFFSISDKAMCDGLKELFQIIYPKKSKYEV